MGLVALPPNELGAACGRPPSITAGGLGGAGGRCTAGGDGTSSGAIGGKSPACVDMLADDGTGGVAAPFVPGGGVAPRGPGGVPPGMAPSGSGVPSTGPEI